MDDSHPNLKIELQGLRSLAAVEECESALKSSSSWKSKQPSTDSKLGVSQAIFSNRYTHVVLFFWWVCF